MESVGHEASGYSGLAQREYRTRHDRMGLRVYWELCRKYGIKSADVWYKEVPDKVRMSEDGKVEIWWDRSVETTRKLEHNRPDITVLDRVARRWTFIDFSVPWDKNVVSKEDEKQRLTTTLLWLKPSCTPRRCLPHQKNICIIGKSASCKYCQDIDQNWNRMYLK